MQADCMSALRTMQRRLSLPATTAVLFVLAAWHGPSFAQSPTPTLVPASPATELERRVDEAFIATSPVYEMARARYNAVANPRNPTPLTPNAAPLHRRGLLDRTARQVTTPNNDTLYSGAWLDLCATLVRIHVPRVDGDRYWSVASSSAAAPMRRPFTRCRMESASARWTARRAPYRNGSLSGVRPTRSISSPQSTSSSCAIPSRRPRRRAIWSVSMYEKLANGRLFFADNPIRRYAVGDRTPGLRRGADGSLELLLQHSPPADISQWLPTPVGEWVLVLRAYLPSDAFRRGEAPLPRLVPAD